MDPLLIRETEKTPEIKLDPYNENFEISGTSRPEDVRGFYYPVINWLTEFRKEILEKKVIKYNRKNPLEFNINLTYFNSASAKFLYDVISELEKFHKKGHIIRILWHYEKGDDDLREAGIEMNDLLNIPFQFIESQTSDK